MKNRMLKYTFTFLFAIISLNAFSQTEISKNNHTGFWDENTTWKDNSSPGNKNLNDITIQGYVTVRDYGNTPGGSITIGQGNTLTISAGDTLVVNGDLTINQDGYLSVETGAILIVLGNFEAKNSVDVSSDSYIVINGNYIAKNGATFNHQPGSELYINGSAPTDGSVDPYVSGVPPTSVDLGVFFCNVQNNSSGATIDCSSISQPLNDCAPASSLTFTMPSITGTITCSNGEIFWTLYDSNNQIFDGQTGKAPANSSVPINTTLPSGSYYLRFQFGNSFCSQDVIISNPPTTGTITK